MNLLTGIFCRHSYEFVRNLYGDQIIEWGYKRSVWRCNKCGKLRGHDKLHDEGSQK
jgi:hypothetical protein